MKKLACRYAIIQFVPHNETGEFVNAGVVLVCPQTGFFDYRLQHRKYGRVTRFFDELDPKVYRAAINIIAAELDRTKDLVFCLHVGAEGQEKIRTLFTSLVHPREAIIRFTETRVVLTERPSKQLDALFDHFVDRTFATPEYVEASMAKRLTALIKQLNLQSPFRAEKIGDDVVHARFPLVQRRGEGLRKVIKPFNLQQPEPNGIFDHGDAWVQKIRRLRERHLLPAEVLFAVAGPPASDAKRYAAFQDICTGLKKLHVQTIDENEEQEIVEFASN